LRISTRMNDTRAILFLSKPDRSTRIDDTSLRLTQNIFNRQSDRRVDMFQSARDKTWNLDLRNISVPWLLQILANSQRPAILTIRSAPYVGTICVRRGKICSASIADTIVPFHPRKAFYRILEWTQGTVELEWTEPPYQRDEMSEDIKTLLQDSVAKQSQLQGLMMQLPAPETSLQVISPPMDINELTADELQLFEMAMQRKTVQAVLDSYPLPDVEACRLLLDLMNRRFVGGLTEPADEIHDKDSWGAFVAGI